MVRRGRSGTIDAAHHMASELDPSQLDRTAGLDAGKPRSSEPGAAFGRYRDLQRLGSGGMATVYQAYDPGLDRVIALKLLLHEDPGHAERLLLEARSQARIQHEHVCPIYEAGVEGGRPYIAMRLVAGVPLSAMAETLPLEPKLKIMKDVAEGVHEAHRVGLVHRDLKPSNIMVERTPDGGWHPYVLDFGLAREVDAPGLTQTGVVLGTPWYMSPEQARGERTLDRRTDVYGLGATMYELLCGTPPFEGASGVGILVKVVQDDPVPVSVRNPAIPVDVQSIVMKCLEKEPVRRYDSARAVAEDIGRYLDGEPTVARPSGLLTRLAKRARKNRAAVATGAVAAVLVAAAGVVALRERAQAAAGARLAAEFARTVKDVEWMLRVAHMAPLHDTRVEKAAVRERLQQIRGRIREVGAPAGGPGEYALGRGELALGNPGTALGHLESAWEAGYRTPEAAYALGLALGALYQRELPLATGITSPDLRRKRLLEIQKIYRDPAIAHLRASGGTDLASPEYVEGLLAFHEGRHAEALAKAEQAAARVPWLFEARLLQGDVHVGLARERHETGDAEGSRRAVSDAEAAYRTAAEYARSSPAALEGLCQIGLQRMEVTLYQRGDLAPSYQATRTACERTVAADADRAEPHAKLANIHRYWTENLIYHGQEPLAALDLATASARQAIALDPRNRRAHGNLGILYRMRAVYEQKRGLPWTDSLAQAIVSLTRSAELSGADSGALNDLGNAYVTRALGEEPSGKDIRPDLKAAIGQYDKALERMADYAYAHANRGNALTKLAEYEIEHSHDPAESLRGAVASWERAVALLPAMEGTHTGLADALALEARWRLSRGEDPGPALGRARGELAEAARVNKRPGPDVFLLAGQLALLEARHLVAQGRPPGAALEEARRQLRTALAANPRLEDAQQGLREAAEIEGGTRPR
jgi:eukaryotic-like serine/threonine-protein kinase